MVKSMSLTNETNRLGDIVSPLLAWYDKNARALPWRLNTDPYRVWVSEIMLQQTQVEAVIPYYHRFIQRLPDIRSLAEADEKTLLKLWEGLGYYSRARNLQKAAQTVMAKYNGKFPAAYCDILSLPGIGKYTAGAIASICFGQPIPAVDGNVLRVAARLTEFRADISSSSALKYFSGILGGIYPKARCGDFTQSLMELGATVCLSRSSPKCCVCPLNFMCQAYRDGAQAELPVKAKKKDRQKLRKTVFLLRSGSNIAVRQREAGILLGGLWEFPSADGHLSPEQAGILLGQWGVSPLSMEEGPRKKHVFSHVVWEMISYVVTCDKMASGFTWVTRKTLAEDLALPSAFHTFLNLI